MQPGAALGDAPNDPNDPADSIDTEGRPIWPAEVRIAGEAGTVEFAIEPLLHLFQLRLEGFAQLRMRVQLCT